MGLGGSVSALWRVFASCGRICGTALTRSVMVLEQHGKGIAYRHRET